MIWMSQSICSRRLRATRATLPKWPSAGPEMKTIRGLIGLPPASTDGYLLGTHDKLATIFRPSAQSGLPKAEWSCQAAMERRDWRELWGTSGIRLE